MQKRRALPCIALFLLFCLTPAFALAAAQPAMHDESFMVQSLDPDISIHLASKRLADKTAFKGKEIVLFAHGVGSPASCFDVSLPGGSWMEYAASRGFMTYAIDFRGYGSSTRPALMKEDPMKNPPYCRTADAVRDLQAAVEWILKKHGVDKINLVGWSWGTAVSAQFTSLNNGKVARLGLYAPVYLQTDKPFADIQGSYRSTTTEGARKARLAGIPADREEDISPIAWFEIMWPKNLASDAEGSKMNPPVMRSPNGGLKDIYETFSQGVSTYDPAAITVPTILVVGEWDVVTPVATSLRLLKDLKGTPNRRLVVVPEATHSLIHERNRMMLLQSIQAFLEEE